MTHEEIIADFHARVERDYRPEVLKHTIPIYKLGVNSNGKDCIQRVKSGIFLHVGSDYFIVTASHHLTDQIKNETQFFLGDVAEGEDPVTVLGVEFYWTESAIRDIGILKIPAEKAERLKQKNECVTMSDIGHDHSQTSVGRRREATPTGAETDPLKSFVRCSRHSQRSTRRRCRCRCRTDAPHSYTFAGVRLSSD